MPVTSGSGFFDFWQKMQKILIFLISGVFLVKIVHFLEKVDFLPVYENFFQLPPETRYQAII